MKKNAKILCSTFGLLSISIATIIPTILSSSCYEDGSEGREEKTYFDITYMIEPSDIIENGTVLKIPDNFIEIDIVIDTPVNGLSSISESDKELLKDVTYIQIPKNVERVNIDIPDISYGILPKFKQIWWTDKDGNVNKNGDPGNILLKSFRVIKGLGERFSDIIIPKADYYYINFEGSKLESIKFLDNEKFKSTDGIHINDCPNLNNVDLSELKHLEEITNDFFSVANPKLTDVCIPKNVETLAINHLDYAHVHFEDEEPELYIIVDCHSFVKSIDFSNCEYLVYNSLEKWFAKNYRQFLKKEYQNDDFSTEINDYDWDRISIRDNFPKRWFLDNVYDMLHKSKE